MISKFPPQLDRYVFLVTLWEQVYISFFLVDILLQGKTVKWDEPMHGYHAT